jgi:hypothetical protein
MPSTIFHRENNSCEEWLIVNDDGTVTYEVENSGWVAAKGSVDNRQNKMTADEAKAKFPSHAEKIDLALAKISKNLT